MKKYIVVDNNSHPDSFDFINEDTTDLDNIWYSTCPYKIEKSELEKIKPLIFENKSVAKLFKNKQQRYSNDDWKKNSHIHKIYGISKPKWRISEY